MNIIHYNIIFRTISKYLYKLEIHDFENIPIKYQQMLNDNILSNYPFIKYKTIKLNKIICWS